MLYSKVSIPGVYSKFHKNDPGRYSKIGFQDLYFECYIPSSAFEGCYLGFLFLVLYSGLRHGGGDAEGNWIMMQICFPKAAETDG